MDRLKRTRQKKNANEFRKENTRRVSGAAANVEWTSKKEREGTQGQIPR